MLHRILPASGFLSQLTLLLLVSAPAAEAFGMVEENRSTLHTYTPAPSRPATSNDPGLFHCRDCWGLKPDERQSLP